MDTITTSSPLNSIRSGDILCVYSSDGEIRGSVKVMLGGTTTTLNVRPLKWYERVWYWAKRKLRFW